MPIRTRLQRLERRLAVASAGDDRMSVTIYLPDNHRGGLPPGCYPFVEGQVVMIIVEPSLVRSVAQEKP
jgi:hypothetical protein